MFDVDLVQVLPISCSGPPYAQAVQGEEASDSWPGHGQNGDHDHGATPLVKVGEKRLIQGRSR